MFERILILADGSAGDRYAVEYGVHLARSLSAELHVLGVIEIPSVSGSIDEVKDLEDEGRHRLQQALQRAREYAEAVGQPATTELLVGPLVGTVLGVIGRRAASLLVMGKADDSLGRDYRHLARNAPCPVFVARENVIREFMGSGDERSEHWEIRPERRIRIEGTGRMLQVFVGEDDRRQGRPVYQLIVERLRQLDMAGATVFSGHLGFGATGRLHVATHRPWSHDRPMSVTVVDTADSVQKAAEAIADLVTNGLIVSAPVEIIKYAHRGAEEDT